MFFFTDLSEVLNPYVGRSGVHWISNVRMWDSNCKFSPTDSVRGLNLYARSGGGNKDFIKEGVWSRDHCRQLSCISNFRSQMLYVRYIYSVNKVYIHIC